MTPIYLYANSLLYLVVAIRSSLSPQRTATALGYLTLSDSGRAEYLVVYGGLQNGLSVLFFLLARHPVYFQLGLLISIGFYAPVVLYRLITGLLNWPITSPALGPLALETLLLAAARWLYYRSH